MTRRPSSTWAAAAALLAACALAFACTAYVDAEELGLVLRFGRVDRVVPPGISLRLPYPIEEIIAVDVTTVRRVDVELARSHAPRDRRHLTADANLLDLELTAHYTVADPIAYTFAAEDPKAAAARILAGQARAVLATMPIDSVLTTAKLDLESRVQRRADKLFDALGLGIELTRVSAVEATPPAMVVEAFNDVASARGDRHTYRIEADAWADRRLSEARADSSTIANRAAADSTRLTNAAEAGAGAFEAMLAEYRKAPRVFRERVRDESAEQVLSGMRLVLTDPAKGPTHVERVSRSR
ncbi:MAG: FtsH protease activity modulator HflK [Gemmatimonadetes bacterium]|nr:FtsH protease activity modulator HflK [Gemmatimonadota bacterium]